MREAAIINDSGFELGSYENKSEMEMLIERAALRGKTESLGEGVLNFTS